MNHFDEELPESAKRAFDSYPKAHASAAFNRAVLDSLARAQTTRRQTFIGRIEEFLGLGLWQFAGSGALGALLPAVVLGVLALSGHTSSPSKLPAKDSVPPLAWPGLSPFDVAFRREHTLA